MRAAIGNLLERRVPAALSMFEALATPHGLDRYLELVNPLLTVRELRAEVMQVRHLSDGSVTVTLRPTHRWRGFTAGQYVRVTVEIDGVRRSRYYSPANSEHRADGRLVLTVATHASGLVSRYLKTSIAVGDVVGLSQAEGTFVLPRPRPAKVLLISAGSGITPVLAMLHTLCDEGYRGDVAFVHYARTELDVAHRAELEALAAAHDNVRVAFGFTRQADPGQLTGRFALSQLETVAPWYAQAETFVCGPAALLDSVRDDFTLAGLDDRLHTETFQPVSLVPVGGPVTGSVSYAASSVAAVNTGATLLDQAEAAGLNPEHGCRMGICFSCTAVKTTGCTRNLVTGELNADPDTEVQLCISVPVGDVTLDL